ncbi:Transposase [Paenibacillus sp. GP183]|nr:Transposase [Paenibacillus sp. GP183]
MEVVIERACGMDIHKDNITACILTSEGKEIQTFSTKTVFLLQLIDWIKQHECTHVAMESTGVFWKPIVNLLEAEGIEFLVVNAQHMKALPGRKTDVKDSEWIANSSTKRKKTSGNKCGPCYVKNCLLSLNS